MASLALPFAGHRRAVLADGRVVLLDVFLAAVDWQGQRKDVLVSRTVGTPLAGMSLLQGSRLTMDVFEGGSVVVDELPVA